MSQHLGASPHARRRERGYGSSHRRLQRRLIRMIVSLTPNTTIDLTVFVPKLITDTTLRASRTVLQPGRKNRPMLPGSWAGWGVPQPGAGLGGGGRSADKSQGHDGSRWRDHRFCQRRGRDAHQTPSSLTKVRASTPPSPPRPCSSSRVILTLCASDYALALKSASVVITGGIPATWHGSRVLRRGDQSGARAGRFPCSLTPRSPICVSACKPNRPLSSQIIMNCPPWSAHELESTEALVCRGQGYPGAFTAAKLSSHEAKNGVLAVPA